MIEVVVQAENRALTTVALVKEQFQILVNTSDVYLARAVLQASNVIEEWCHRRFAWQVVKERMGSSGECELLVTNRPVVSVAAASFCDQAIDPASILITDPEAGILFRRDGFYSSRVPSRVMMQTERSAYSAAPDWMVQYTAGYICFGEADEVPPVGVLSLPAGLVRAATDAVGIFYDDRKRNLLRKRESEGDGSADYATFEEFLEDRCWLWRSRV